MHSILNAHIYQQASEKNLSNGAPLLESCNLTASTAYDLVAYAFARTPLYESTSPSFNTPKRAYNAFLFFLFLFLDTEPRLKLN